MKVRRCYLLLTALAITTLGICWALYGNYSADTIRFGWRMFLYQLPLVNAIFLPLLATILASRICGIEHKGYMLKSLCCITKRGALFDAKLLYGISIMTLCTLISWSATIIFGIYKGFSGNCPMDLYFLYLLFTLVPTLVIYIFQHTLSLIFKNQAISFFIGIIGEFAGLFSMFLPQLPWLRRLLLWGYYGVLQFVGMYGWTKETRWTTVHFDVMPIAWDGFITLLAGGIIIYVIGRYWFCKKEV